LHDLFPTICELTGCEVPESVETKSFKALLKKPNKDIRSAMHYAYSSWRYEKVDGQPVSRGHHRAIRKGDYKLILSMYDGVVTEQLFNLKADPYEMNNLLKDKQYEGLRSDLLSELKKKIEVTGDYVELDNPDWGFKWGGEK